MHNTTDGHQSDVTRAQRGSVTYPRRRRRDTNKPQGKLFPFSFSPKPQVHHSTTQQVGHISKTHYKQHSFAVQGSAEQLCLWELALFLPTLVIIRLQCPLHQYSARELEHCSSFIWIVSYCYVSFEKPAEQCFRHAGYSSSINKSSFNVLKMTRLRQTDIHGRAQGERAQLTWHQIFFSVSANLFLADTLPIRRETIDNWQSTKPNKDPESLSTAAWTCNACFTLCVYRVPQNWRP